MRGLLKYFPLIFLIACQDLADLEPSETETYVKFFGDRGNNFAVKVLETPEGDFLCLGYNEVTVGESITTRTLFFKTNKYGNLVWVSNSVNDIENFRAKDMDVGADGGYYIIGDGINLGGSGNNSIMLLKTNSSGVIDGAAQAQVDSISPASSVENFSATAVYASGDNEVIGLGYWVDGIDNELFYLQFSFTDPSGFDWVKELNSSSSYSPGRSLVKDVASQKYIWVASTATEGIAFKASGNQIPGLLLPLPVSFAVDIDQNPLNDHFGGIGTDGADNVIFYDLSQSMALIDSHILTTGEAQSITGLNSGGYAILTSAGGNFTLHKTTSGGYVTGDGISTFSRTIDWSSTESNGHAIQVSDGGFVVLGSSRSLNSMIVLIKTDGKGEL